MIQMKWEAWFLSFTISNRNLASGKEYNDKYELDGGDPDRHVRRGKRHGSS